MYPFLRGTELQIEGGYLGKTNPEQISEIHLHLSAYQKEDMGSINMLGRVAMPGGVERDRCSAEASI